MPTLVLCGVPSAQTERIIGTFCETSVETRCSVAVLMAKGEESKSAYAVVVTEAGVNHRILQELAVILCPELEVTVYMVESGACVLLSKDDCHEVDS